MIQQGVLADSTPLYAGVDSSDQYSARAGQEIELLSEQQLETVILTPVLSEVHNLLLHRLGVSTARQWLLEMFESAALVNPAQGDYAVALEIVQRFMDQPITPTDAVVAAMSQWLHLSVWTYNHHFDIRHHAG